jgi:hypothetical protein
MKKISLIALAVLMIAATFITVVRAEDTTAQPTETRIEIGKEEAEEIVKVLEKTSSKAEAVLMVAEKFGITSEEAERLIDVVLEVGDAYFGQDQWWIAFKNNIEKDAQYWTAAIVFAMAVISVAVGAVVFLVRRNASKTVKITSEIARATAEAMGHVELLVSENIKKYEDMRLLLDSKERDNELLLEKLTALEESNERERRDMLITEGYNLRMLKLIIDRTPLPLADKATIDLFYAKGMEPIRSGLSAEDLAKMDQTIATLDKTKNNE